MVLVTGPTGSGKTTTLYSALQELNQVSDNISTAEDPVEFNLAGINQVQMHEDIGLNFAAALRSFLRQDPDIIMIGEIRDFETAEIAVKAALTGHLVLSTLHTNDAPSTITRLLNMGIEPFLVTASVNLVVAQRLLRKICADCKEPIPTPKDELQDAAERQGRRDRHRHLLQGRRLQRAATAPATRAASRVYEVMPFWRRAQGAGAPGRVGGRAQGGGDPAAACAPCACAASPRSARAPARSKKSPASRRQIEQSTHGNRVPTAERQPASAPEGDGREGGVRPPHHTGSPPQLRIDGELVPLKRARRSAPVETKQLCYSILTDAQKHKFEEDQRARPVLRREGPVRASAPTSSCRGRGGGCFRTIPFKILTFEELGLPPVIAELCNKPRGLVLVTGPTGSGKSTTLAAMIDKINTERHEHIITIEDPIEFLHQHKNCVVNQREVGADTQSFKKALKYILRQDPDVVLVGEMRDLETIEAALTIAETGHLVLRARCTPTRRVQTINRIIDVFPPYQQSQIRAQLSFVLEGVVCQTLLPKAAGRAASPALEVMIPNSAIRNLIREDKVHQIYSQMQIGQGTSGMQTLNQCLAGAVPASGQVTLEEAIGASSDPERAAADHRLGRRRRGRRAASRPPGRGDKRWRRNCTAYRLGGPQPQRRGQEGRDGGRQRGGRPREAEDAAAVAGLGEEAAAPAHASRSAPASRPATS